jgi:hypothetical protein
VDFSQQPLTHLQATSHPRLSILWLLVAVQVAVVLAEVVVLVAYAKPHRFP